MPGYPRPFLLPGPYRKCPGRPPQHSGYVSIKAVCTAVVLAFLAAVFNAAPSTAQTPDTLIIAPSTVTAGERFVVRTYWMVGTKGRNCLQPVFDFGGESAVLESSFTVQCEFSSKRTSKRFKKEMVAREFTYRDPGVYTITVQAGLVSGKTFKPLRLTKERLRGPRTITHTITVTEPALDQPSSLPENWREQMLDAVNYERNLVGLAPVRMCASLQKAAQRFAKYEATEDFYAHIGPDGSNPGSRVSEAGYRSWSIVGENLHKGPDSVSEAMAGWVASPGHYENLVDPAFTHAGFGYAEGTAGPWPRFWVQNFGDGGRCN